MGGSDPLSQIQFDSVLMAMAMVMDGRMDGWMMA